MNKKVLRTKEAVVPSTMDEQDELSSSESEGENLAMRAVMSSRGIATQYNPTGLERKKPRIPWDRNPHGDKNGLKYALLSVVNDHSFHVDGRLMENFREVSRILSSEGSKFEKYEGIEPSGAQRKFNAILKDVASTYYIKENGEFEGEENAEGFEALAIKILKDIINREKAKYTGSGQKPPRADQLLNASGEDIGLSTSNASVDDVDHNGHSEGAVLSATFLKKRKAEITPLKHALKRVAASTIPANAANGSEGEEDDIHDTGINRLDLDTHNRVVQELEKIEIRTVGDLLKAADISAQGIQNFSNKTQVKLTKPVDRILKLFEEVAVAKDFVAKMQALCGLQAGDALEFESFVKPYYTAARVNPNSN